MIVTTSPNIEGKQIIEYKKSFSAKSSLALTL